MLTKSRVQYTLRGIPAEVDRALRKKAREKKVSLNRLLVDELIKASEVSCERTYRSLKQISGRWKDDPEFDRALAEQRSG